MKILMVCLGNICRSPLAEGIMRQKIEQRGLLGWRVDSAGTGGWHAGEGPDSRSARTALQHGIDIRDQRARQFKPSDFDAFDVIFAMDEQNLLDICRQARSEAQIAKARLILDESRPGERAAVPDPYYGGIDGFEAVFQMLDEACDAFLSKKMNS